MSTKIRSSGILSVLSYCQYPVSADIHMKELMKIVLVWESPLLKKIKNQQHVQSQNV